MDTNIEINKLDQLDLSQLIEISWSRCCVGLVKSYYPQLRGESLEDIEQDTKLYVITHFEKRFKFNDEWEQVSGEITDLLPIGFRQWTQGIALNFARNEFRREKRFLASAEFVDSLSDNELPFDGESQVDRLIKRDLIEVCLSFINDLPDKERIPIKLYFCEGLTIERIAQRLNIHTRTVNRRLKSGLTKVESLTTRVRKRADFP